MFNRIVALATGWLALVSTPALAAEPKPWQLNLPHPASPVAELAYDFHTILLWIITIITIFVAALLVYVCVRFRESANPTPSRTTHNSLLEVLWTGIPVLILVAIVFPSMKLLYASDRVEDADMTLKIIGNQWYWSYEYPDHGNFTFDAYVAARTADEAKELGVARLMDTDNMVVLPVDTKIRLIMTSNDVLHNWSISDFGVRLDTVPGRLNETWMQATREGTFYGFCSELCGIDHAFMPIAVKIVSKAEFEKWVTEAQEKFADLPVSAPVKVAAKSATPADNDNVLTR
ncbi:cytochrome c oxidase subunit II [Hwanghaeella grinnelliae]|uniref:Cytochrome c oxidase subunit 2 n=1 Tax=Hwanghaeella grinnelliae TaxID=2500179 RepID=A0A3S2VLK5_9PROT|nr:cytochrome c oxidase subunit II [Hwanghaeella grinnelliae]RVU35062.1 cytochrome c oxidase subunit II [Hwanghaeella grinnelliae]